MSSHQSALMETERLQTLLSQPDVKILDASYHIPPSPRQALSEFEQTRIPNAQFFDIDTIADTSSPLPHMTPSTEDFERHMQRLGIQNEDTVVIYDCHGLMSAPRAWWMFRYFGHDKVYVLNGGLPKWLAENRPLASGAVTVSASSPSRFQAKINPQLLCPLESIKSAASQPDDPNASIPLPFQLVDMRPEGRFNGTVPEPRAGLKSGHIPGSVNAPWSSWLSPQQTLLNPIELKARCETLGLNPNAPSVMSCGSGVTACVGALAFYELGNASTAVYDGAWAEWGSLPDVPVSVKTH